jgi:hypothetical protein
MEQDMEGCNCIHCRDARFFRTIAQNAETVSRLFYRLADDKEVLGHPGGESAEQQDQRQRMDQMQDREQRDKDKREQEHKPEREPS